MQRYLTFLLLIISAFSYSQKNNKFSFTFLCNNKVTSVKDQYLSSTCWSYGTISFLEAELLRAGKGEFDLSEMYIVRNIYPLKVKNYIRWHGNVYFTPGGQSHDVIRIVKEYGLVPENIFPSSVDGSLPVHAYLDTVARKFVSTALKTGPQKADLNVFEKAIDTLLKPRLTSFVYEGLEYTPSGFVQYLGINPDDYIEITSFSDHDFYKPFILDSRFNWSHDKYYNVPLDDFMEIIDSALFNGYTIAWDGDVSEDEFSFYDGLALAPEKPWNDKTNYEKSITFLKPGRELVVNQDVRQKAYASLCTKIDHIMHTTAIAVDQNGTKYYYTKNSWGTNNPYDGYVFISESYMKLKTVAFMVNKNAIPNHIADKMNL